VLLTWRSRVRTCKDIFFFNN